MKNKKICFCISTLDNGGAQRVIVTLCNELVSQGYDISLLLTTSLDKHSFYDLNPKINLIVPCENKKKKVNFIKRVFVIRSAIKKLKPDVLICFLSYVCVYIYFASLFLNIPIIVSERNDPNNEEKGKMIRQLKEYVFRHADGCVFQTEDAKKYYLDRYKINNPMIIYNPIHINDFDQIIKNQNNNFDNTIISVGRLAPQKNYKLLINSFEVFNRNHNNEYKLKIYGDGVLEDDLNSYIENKNLSNSVSLMGSYKTWAKDNSNARMFVLSSDFEGVPNVLLEAMSIGIPCISTDCPIGGPREFINNLDNGILVPVNDSKSLVSAMERVASDDKLCMKFRKNNSLLHEKLSPSKISDIWIKYIYNVLESKQ